MWNGISIVKNDENHNELNFKYEKNNVGKSMLQLNYSFYASLFFNFDITMTYFLNSYFSFFMCDKYNVINSKVHNESSLF
jgi:hypothetical protein